MAEVTKQKVPQKNTPANKTRVAAGYNKGTSEPEVGTAVPISPAPFNHLPDHPTTRPLRQSAVLQMQRQFGNAHAQRRLTGNHPPEAETSFNPGQPLDSPTRSRLEPVLGHEFSDVEVHTDSQAAALASHLSARAVTLGNDIAFASGEYQPGTFQGDSLIAHELAHVAQQQRVNTPLGPQAKEESEGTTYNALEQDADRSTIGVMASIWARMKGMATNVARTAMPQLTSGLRLQRCSRPSPGTIRAKKVDFTGSHAMTAYGSDPKAKPEWTPTSTDHAAAYTKGTNPSVNAQFDIAGTLPDAGADAGARTVSVRVKEGGAVRGMKSGITPTGNTANITGLTLTGLTGSTEVRASNYNFEWEVSEDGTTWVPIDTTGIHHIYWVQNTPSAAPLYNMAVAKATGYAAGAASAAALADAIRHGLRGIDGLAYDPADPINSDPLAIYSDGVGICTDFANVLVLLAKSVGLTANPAMFWGGFESLGQNIWITVAGSLINLTNVKSPNAAYHPPATPLSPHGWAFNYHSIARIDGVLQDAALDRQGIDGEAVHAGKIIRLMEDAGGALPVAKKNRAYSAGITRRDHTVALTIRDYGAMITTGDFASVHSVPLPPGAVSPYDAPVFWLLDSGSLPPGLTLGLTTGLISGTPTATGTYSFVLRAGRPGLTNTFPRTLKVKKK